MESFSQSYAFLILSDFAKLSLRRSMGLLTKALITSLIEIRHGYVIYFG